MNVSLGPEKLGHEYAPIFYYVAISGQAPTRGRYLAAVDPLVDSEWLFGMPKALVASDCLVIINTIGLEEIAVSIPL